MPTDEIERGIDAPYFDLSVEKFESELELGEFPIFSTDKCVFTNKNIRFHVKKPFRKKQSIVLPWNDPIDLKWVPSGLQKILLQANGVTILEIGSNLNSLGLSKAKTLTLSKKETLELYKPDLDNLTKAIQELKQQLSV
ncbi:hypothetical protein DXC69_12960 [Paenibacillus polymyxa]|nr:hypothetical protein DXC69_12960 [Paenibacillus polymyxa]